MAYWAWFSCTNLIPFIPCLLFLYYMYNNCFISTLKLNLLLFRTVIMNVHRIHDWFTENNLSVNGNLYFRSPYLSGMAFLITCDPANMRHILTEIFHNYPKGADFIEIFDGLGDGILNTDGESWRYQRQKLQLVMSRKVFRTSIAKTTQEKIHNTLLPFLSKTVEQGLMIDLQDMFARLTFDMTCILSFGTDTGSLSIDFPDVPFARAVDEAAAAVFSRIIRPATWWKLLRFLGIGQEKKLAKARVVIDEFLAESIERRKQETKEGKLVVCPDLLSSYLSDEDIPNSTKFLRDLVYNFLVEGRDTVSSGLTWFFWVLSQNKQAEEKILQELRSVRRNITPEGMISFDLEELEKLVYLEASIIESLRLYPSIPLNFKTVLKPDLLPSGFTVTPGMKIILSSYATGRMQKIWGEDCLEFKPERWISEKRTLKHVPSYKYPAFSTGPRSCLGKNMTLIQMKMVVATMLYNFSFEVVEGQIVEPALSVALHMKNGLMVRITKRTS